jgi:hypothetical protein
VTSCATIESTKQMDAMNAVSVSALYVGVMMNISVAGPFANYLLFVPWSFDASDADFAMRS